MKPTERNGFKVSKDGMIGPGVYTTSDIEKAAIFTAQHEAKRCFGVVCWTWMLAGARRITLWVVLNLINLVVCADWLQENYESQEVPAGAGMKRTETVVRNPRQISILGVIMESIRHSPSDCREKGNARKDCSKLLAWLVGCERCKTEGASDTGKLECATNQRGRSRFRDHWWRGG